MSGRKFRNLLVVVILAGIGYWFYKDRPTLSGFIDSITDPLFGSKAAVKSSERNRVVGDASTAINEQSDAPVGSLREGMTSREVRELMGEPSSREDAVEDGVKRLRWNYKDARRTVVIQDDRVVSIVIR